MLYSSGGEPRLCYPLVIGDPTVSAWNGKPQSSSLAYPLSAGWHTVICDRVDFQLVNGFCSQCSFIPLIALFSRIMAASSASPHTWEGWVQGLVLYVYLVSNYLTTYKGYLFVLYGDPIPMRLDGIRTRDTPGASVDLIRWLRCQRS